MVGDSITAGLLPLDGTTVLGSNSWIPSATEHPRLDFVGGWAVPGATTNDMLAHAAPIAADVLVVLAGTNDVATSTAWPVTEANLATVIDTAQVPSVVLAAVPPRNQLTEPTRQLNAQLEELAENRGWTFIDPWSDMAADGRWADETSLDGIHPSQPVAALAGDRLAAAIAAAG